MNKTDIIATVAEVLEMPKTRVSAVLNTSLDLIQETVAEGETVSIAGFGTFSARYRSERFGRNPQTGEAILIEARKAPHFKAGRTFKEIVNG